MRKRTLKTGKRWKESGNEFVTAKVAVTGLGNYLMVYEGEPKSLRTESIRSNRKGYSGKTH
jgi:hypothetical protein